ncbi:Uncharacterized conserved protein YkwD, contains CAP (CSP/antigen 5/PR1) domain [Quadrisphaera granulorum]|uniref:Uncharacterized protein YkwD n=1 Tax=Quadrisphaera granulorum TaxID=317664 RepID=A0A316A6X3_9ACTN|nr:CAP domain-containing protein [Quadrisphaera granulorum]PWJ53631.1 uncharacterized protein YkwD [Quadrisphaera granulorum]SZE96675.1 Uncharacterized conserved protein YkwD, contains CAP (CSP/antigen 5/PR1) domain [Quadrisphaera granulorum]
MSARATVRRFAATGLAAALLAGGLGVAAVAPASAAPADCSYYGYNSRYDRQAVGLDYAEVKLFNDINAYRAANGLPALRLSNSLARPAMWASLDSAVRGFSPSNHVDSRGMNIPQRAQYCSGYTGPIGEINYWGWGSKYAGSNDAALAWWKQSPGHNAMLLSRNYTTMSVAWAYMGVNAEVRGHWTVNFGVS